MMQDVYKCLGTDITCGGVADAIIPKGDTIDLLQKDNVYGAIEIKFEIQYQTSSFDQTEN
jgi:hypothetical protein